ncbi:MAG: cation-transporting P-type ATPase [Anaeromassilibacillus sp.]
MLKNHEINALTEQEAEESRKKYGSNMLTHRNRPPSGMSCGRPFAGTP